MLCAMRNIFKHKGREITWPQALVLTGLWFLLASAAEAVLMTVLFTPLALFRVYVMDERDFLLYVILGAWIVVIGHFIAMIVVGFGHKSWKIVFLYISIPVGIGIFLFLWISAGIGNMMAA